MATVLLHERYGNKQLIIATHMSKLLKLEKVKNGRSSKEVRDFFDKIEGHVRSLVSVGVHAEHYGPLLIPIVLDRLPDDIKLQISRTLGDGNWHIEEFMKILKQEIMARESCDYMRSQSGGMGSNFQGEGHETKHFTTESLLNSARVLICAFCKQNHFHDQCKVVTDNNERKNSQKGKAVF